MLFRSNQLPWNKTGTGVLFNAKEYNPKDREDLKLLVDTYNRLGRAEIQMKEADAEGLAIQRRFKERGGQQPSLYAPPVDWTLYRNQERNRGLIPNLDVNRYNAP